MTKPAAIRNASRPDDTSSVPAQSRVVTRSLHRLVAAPIALTSREFTARAIDEPRDG